MHWPPVTGVCRRYHEIGCNIFYQSVFKSVFSKSIFCKSVFSKSVFSENLFSKQVLLHKAYFKKKLISLILQGFIS